MSLTNKMLSWRENIQTEGVSILNNDGGVIVSPTKVGYIILTTDAQGLERKFRAKNRRLNKPGVVLCSSIEQLCELAEINEEIRTFYQTHWDNDILLGCILPWKESGKTKIPNDGADKLMMDNRASSCFVIKFGTPSEQIVQNLWEKHGKLVFASSANPSGKGNRGLVEGIGHKIEEEVDLIIEANGYIASIQPEKNINTRYEQGVMVSMVDEKGSLIPLQDGKRSVSPAPTVIRVGLNIDFVMGKLSEQFLSWNFRQGQYY